MGTKSTRKKVIKKTKTDIEFEKAKRNVKMIGIVATIFLFISFSPSSSFTTSFLIKKLLFPIGWISK